MDEDVEEDGNQGSCHQAGYGTKMMEKTLPKACIRPRSDANLASTGKHIDLLDKLSKTNFRREVRESVAIAGSGRVQHVLR